MEATSSTTLTTELEKVTWLLRYLKCEHFTEQMIAGFDLKRLGKKRDSFNRVLKVRLTSVEDRDAFLQGGHSFSQLEFQDISRISRTGGHPVLVNTS